MPPVTRPCASVSRLVGCLALSILLPGLGRPGAVSAQTPPPGAAPAVAPEQVRVERHDNRFSVDLRMHTPVSADKAFAVLTDFDHMTRFVPNLQQSQVLERQGAVWKVSQKGQARWGIFTLNFESVRELTLSPPREIRAHTLSGNVRQMDSVMTLTPEPGGTELHYHAEVEPGSWFPLAVGPALVQHETAEQFSAILHEMSRRP